MHSRTTERKLLYEKQTYSFYQMVTGFHVLRRDAHYHTCPCHSLWLWKVRPVFQSTYFIPQHHFHVVRNPRRLNHP